MAEVTYLDKSKVRISDCHLSAVLQHALAFSLVVPGKLTILPHLAQKLASSGETSRIFHTSKHRVLLRYVYAHLFPNRLLLLSLFLSLSDYCCRLSALRDEIFWISLLQRLHIVSPTGGLPGIRVPPVTELCSLRLPISSLPT